VADPAAGGAAFVNITNALRTRKKRSTERLDENDTPVY